MKKRVTMNMTPVMGHNRPYPRSPRSKVNSTKDYAHNQGEGQSKFLPKRATYVLSILKLICGCGLVVLGALALYMKASYSRTASGVWGGIVVIISGVLGTFTAKMNGFRPYVFFFFISCVLAIITDVLVTIYAATGLARDSGYPGGFILDDYTGDLIPVSQVNIPAREKAMVVNLLLIVMGVFEILFTLPCFIICLREICQCYDEEYVLSKHREAANAHPLQASNEWLMSWLGHQNQVFYSASSGIPYRKIQPYPIYNQSPPPYVMVQSDHSRQGSNRIHRHSPRDHQPPPDRSSSYTKARPHRTTSTPRSSGRKSAMVAHYTPLEVYAPPPTHYYYAPPPSYHSPGSNLSQRSLPALVPVHAPSSHSQMGGPPTHAPPTHTWFYGSAPEDYEAYLEGRPFSRRKRARDQEPYPKMEPSSRHPRTRNSRVPPPNEPFTEEQMYRRVKKKKNKHLGPTDSDLDKTYTGLDRELAEEFIEQTMDPNSVLNRSGNIPLSGMNAPSTASLPGGVPQGSTVSASNSQFNPRMSTFSANDSEEAW